MAAQLPEIVLASSSPRRRELLDLLRLPYRVVSPDIPEEAEEGEGAHEFARRMAREKANWVANRLDADEKPSARLVIAADTVVSVDEHILGKPSDEIDAAAMLRMLSGSTHQVITGLCVRACDVADVRSMTVTTDIDMKPLSETEIAAYVATGEPLDKAGAYAIQGGAAYMVRSVRGSYTNVVGLPLAELSELIQEITGADTPGTSP